MNDTILTKERAEYIWAHRGFQNRLPRAFSRQGDYFPPDEDGLTKEEDAYIREVWNGMPGYTCYFDAFMRIKNQK